MNSKLFFLFTFSFHLTTLAADTNFFESKALSVSLKKPAQWFFTEANSKYVNNPLKEGKLRDLLKEKKQLPFVVISKFKEPYKNLNPSFQAIASSLPQEKISSGKILEFTAKLLSKNLDKFTVTEEISEFEIDGRKGSTLVATYVTTGPDNIKYDVKVRYWIVVRDSILFTMAGTSLKEQTNYSEDEFEQIFKSIQL